MTKKFFSLLLALVIVFSTMGALSVNAGLKPFGNKLPYGSREAVPVPKVTAAPVIDGLFDDLYNERSLVIPVTRDVQEGNGQKMGNVYGFAYIVFDNTNLYIYVDCYDSTVWNVLDYIQICSECGKQLGALKTSTSKGCTHGKKVGSTYIWDDDCVEIMVDFTNSGKSTQVCGYRVSRANFCSRDFDTWNLGFKGVAHDYGKRWGAEFAIPLDTSEEGTEIGLNGMIHSQESTKDSPSGKFSETIAYFDNSAEYGSLWEAEFYDYIVLGNETSPGNTKSGTCGANLTWTYENGTLTISGTGEMYNYYNYDFSFIRPWHGFQDKITAVKINYGVMSIGHYAFSRCTSLTSVTIPDSVTSISDHAFWECDKCTIYGNNGSYAQTYAKENNIPFTILSPVNDIFYDIVPDEWYVSAVQYVVDNGLFFGLSDNEFAPNEAMNRAMLVTVLWRLEGKPTVSATNTFNDVPADEWYTNAVIWAAENGVVYGTGEKEFSPGDNITREQMAAILYRYAQKKGYDVTASTGLDTFPDGGSTSSYARTALSWACGSGLIFGSDGKLLPQDGATRAQVAAILMRYTKKVVQK